MKANNRSSKVALWIWLTVIALSATSQAQLPEAGIFKYFRVKINLFSVNPHESVLDSYKTCGSATGSAGAILGLCYSCQEESYSVRVHLLKNENKNLVDVTVTPDRKESSAKKRTWQFDLTDMKPVSLELEKLDNGQIYRLNIIPSVEIIDNRPKRADEAAQKLGLWDLSSSIVIFNDHVYAGQVNCSGGPMAFVSYPGYAKVEFALVPFPDAEMIGMLKEGCLRIHGPNYQTLDIYDVKNSPYGVKLPGGPYEVWARWKDLPPSEEKMEIPSKEEWIQLVKEHYTMMGTTPPVAAELDELYEKTKNQKHIPLSSGVGPIH